MPPATSQKLTKVADSSTSDQLENLQHFIELGRLSATLLHEISNPLTAALLHLEKADSQGSASIRQARRNLRLLKSYVEAARQQLRQQSQHRYHQSAFCIHPHIEQLKRIVLPLARSAGVQLVFEDIPHYQLLGDPVKFQQVLANLIINAIDAYSNCPNDGLAKPIRISISTNPHSVTIKIIDWGEGIPADRLPRIFEPFYTTKQRALSGLGIGLAIVKQHVTIDFHGLIHVTSSQRYGTQFILKLPGLPYPPHHLRKKSN